MAQYFHDHHHPRYAVEAQKHKDSRHPSKHCAGGLLHILLPRMRNAAFCHGHAAASNNFKSGDGLCKIVVYLKSASGSIPWEHYYTRNGLQGPIPSSQLLGSAWNAFQICFWAKSSRLGGAKLRKFGRRKNFRLEGYAVNLHVGPRFGSLKS